MIVIQTREQIYVRNPGKLVRPTKYIFKTGIITLLSGSSWLDQEFIMGVHSSWSGHLS